MLYASLLTFLKYAYMPQSYLSQMRQYTGCPKKKYSCLIRDNLGTRLRLVRTFLFFTRHDLICDLLQYRRTQNEIYLLKK